MHQLISAIVYAKTEEEALDKAKNIFEGLCGEQGQPFDYFATFDEDNPRKAGGSLIYPWTSSGSNFGSLPVVARADSKEGKQLIDRLMKSTKREFMNHISLIRRALAVMSNEELFTEELSTPTEVLNRLSPQVDRLTCDPHMIKYYLEQAGASKGAPVFLYDQDGRGIRTPGHLQNVLEKWQSLAKEGEESPYQTLDIWVIPCDVHH